MRILYGIQTAGNEHMNRSRLVISHLKQLGHNIHVIFSGPGIVHVEDLSLFEPYTMHKGHQYAHKRPRIDAVKSLLNTNINTFNIDLTSFNAAQFDLVISDFEPISVCIARSYGIKSIGLSHQCALIYSVPKAWLNLTGKLFSRMFAPAELPIGLHWHHFNQPLLPPIIDNQLCCDKPVIENKILVYLPFENHYDLREQLLQFRDYDFFVYQHGQDELADRNIHWKAFSKKDVIDDLKSSSGIYCDAGFELPSEALHLGKK